MMKKIVTSFYFVLLLLFLSSCSTVYVAESCVAQNCVCRILVNGEIENEIEFKGGKCDVTIEAKSKKTSENKG